MIQLSYKVVNAYSTHMHNIQNLTKATAVRRYALAVVNINFIIQLLVPTSFLN